MSKKYTTLRVSIFIITYLFMASCVNKDIDNNKQAKNKDEIYNLLIEGAINSIIKFKKDTVQLQNQLEKSIELNDTILQMVINKQLGQIHAENYNVKSAVLNKNTYLSLTQKVNSDMQELIALNDLGKYYYKIDILDDALRFYFNALSTSKRITNKSDESNYEIASTKLGIGMIYIQFDNKVYASQWLDEALTLANNLSDKTLQSDIYIAKGELSKEKHQYDSAKIYFDKALDGYIHENSIAGLGKSFLQLGNLCIDLNEYEEAIISLDNAIGTLKDTSEKVNIMKATLLLGKAYLRLYNYPLAESHLLHAADLSKKLNSAIHNRSTNLALAEMYFAKNDIDKSSKYNELARKFERDINHSKIQSGIFNASVEYEKERNKQEIDQIKTIYTFKSKSKNTIIVITFATILFLIALFIFFDLYWRKKRERNESIISSALLKVNLFNHISMELKSPLNIIEGLVDNLKGSIKEENKATNFINLEVIERQTQNITFLINEILSLSQSKYNVKSKWVNGNIVNFLSFLFNSFMDDAKARGVNMIFLTNQQSIVMNFCKERLQLAIINILYVSIRNSVKDDNIYFSISNNDIDTTCLISIVHKRVSAKRENIPYKFKDLLSEFDDIEPHTSKNHILLQQTIEDMGGVFSLQEDNEYETSFNISFQVKNNKRFEKYDIEQEIEIDTPKTKEEIDYSKLEIHKSSPDNKSKKETIMIVEDNQFMSFYISSLISNKYNIVACQSGVEALEIIKKDIPDLIIVDLILPQIDGNQLTGIIKNNPSTSHVPIIMNIVKGSNSARIKSIKAGVDAFLVKPFSEEELQALIEQLLNSRKGLLKKMAQTFVEKHSISQEPMDDDLDFIKKVGDLIYSEMSNINLSTQMIADKMNIST